MRGVHGMINKEKLIRTALDARSKAYAPYSNYLVGAAVLAENGQIYSGCNIENASYPATICAERTAISKAVSEGARKILAVAIAGGLSGKEPVDYAFPCGVCRQVMKEFGGNDLLIYVVKSPTDYKEFRLEELLPYGFGGESIQ